MKPTLSAVAAFTISSIPIIYQQTTINKLVEDHKDYLKTQAQDLENMSWALSPGPNRFDKLFTECRAEIRSIEYWQSKTLVHRLFEKPKLAYIVFHRH